MTPSITDVVAEQGYVFISGYEVREGTAAVAASLGQLIVPWEGGSIQELTPRAEATPNTYSGIYAFGEFPFHTDLAHWKHPPRYLLLRCIRGYADVFTLLLDGCKIFDADVLDILMRAIVKPRRPLDGKMTLLRLCELCNSGYRFRWDEVFLTPASKIGKVAHQRLREVLAESKPIAVPLIGPGDTLLIDNWRMLHARSQVPVDRQDRRIERAYLEALI